MRAWVGVAQDTSKHVRRCAVEALGNIAMAGDEMALQACSDALKDSHWLVAEAAGASCLGAEHERQVFAVDCSSSQVIRHPLRYRV